ncbi:hypothetical protein C3L33_00753, partial [Rhododendron williamsianum]
MARRMKAAAETGDINGLYDSIKEDPNVLDSIDAIPFVDTPLHTAASAGHTDFAVEILRLKPSFGRKLNPDGLSSLHLALINHKFDTVKRLIKLDKKLIRVKGKQGETPLHFIARKEDINADQEQRELDDHRVNTLAEFLFACPYSIDDLTNQDETALHIAVKTNNISAVEIILGLIRWIKDERLMANKDDKGNTALHLAVKNSQLELVKLLVKESSFADRNAKNSATLTALDIALLLEQSDEAKSIVNTLRCAGALESSSSANNYYSLAKFLNSPAGPSEVVYRLKFFMDRAVSIELRNIGMVVAVLIATATFTAVLSPPGGVGGGGNDLLSNGGNVNATVSSTNNLFGPNTSFINATLSIPTDNPAKRLLFKDDPDTYGPDFLNFYVWNTGAFVLSMAMIMFVLPVLSDLFALLKGALLCMMVAYGSSFSLMSPPSSDYSEIFYLVSVGCAILVFFCNFMAIVIEDCNYGRRLGRKRLKMLKRLLDNME